MPKRTAMLLFLCVGAALTTGFYIAGASRDAPFALRHEVLNWTRSAALGLLLTIPLLWAVLNGSPYPKRDWAIATIAVAFVLGEISLHVSPDNPYRGWELFQRINVPVVMGSVGGALFGCYWLRLRGLTLSNAAHQFKERPASVFRFSLLELFLLTTTCGVILGCGLIAAYDPFSGTPGKGRMMLLFALSSLPHGLISGLMGWAILSFGAPWRRLVAAVVGWWVFDHGLLLLLMSGNVAVFPWWSVFAYHSVLIAAQGIVFWSLRSAGYRLVWRETATLGDNPTPAG